MYKTRPEIISHDHLWPLVARGATVVTVNRRLARYLFERFTDDQVQSGRVVWKTPDILSYAAFLQRSAKKTAPLQKEPGPGLLLSSVQERHLWEQIIRRSGSGQPLLKVTEAADLARQAWEILQAWKIPFSEIQQLPPPETSVFLKWVQIYKARCRENNWLDSATLPAALAKMIAAERLPPPEMLVLAGFDEFPPREQDLLKALSAAGVKLFMLDPPLRSGQAVRCGFADAASEMAAAACWSRRLVESGAGRIGIIVPDLHARQGEIARVFDDVFHPGRVLSPAATAKRLFNISLGETLGSRPLIDAAIKILSGAIRPMGADHYGEILRSPFIGGASAEGSRRALLEARLRKHNVTAVTCEELAGRIIAEAHHPGFFPCPILSARLQEFCSRLRHLPKQQRPSAWAKTFSDLLSALGWPGDRPLSSEEFQIVEAWKEALSDFCGLDRTGAETGMAAALDDLTNILSGRAFQPESAEAPVQIMGVLEAAGEFFDHLWIMGMHDGQWPPPAVPNPFLPVRVQRKYNVAHASADREFWFSQMVTRRLLDSADDIVVSYPAAEGDAQLFPSPLISHLAEAGPAGVENQTGSWWTKIAESAEMENIKDRTGPEVGENAGTRGGTGLLKAQALCPFSAFAGYRLGAERLEVPVSGLTARDRGTLMHRTLEYLFQELTSLSELLSKTDKDLDGVIRCAVDRSIQDMAKDRAGVFMEAFTALEQERLVALMYEWLRIERQRGDFAVADREKRIEAVIGGVSLTAVADRIDKTDHGLVIIDYKTGTPSESDWFTERLADPQLPLYSITAAEPVAGVLFAQVRRGESRYRGIALNETVAPGIRGLKAAHRNSEAVSSMDDVIENWRIKIESLALEVRRGVAAVAPVSINKSCRYCDLGPLCRIAEADLLGK